MSWQNTLLTLWLRLKVKRLNKGAIDVERARVVARRTALKVKVPDGWRLTESAEPPLNGDCIEPDAPFDPVTGRTILFLHGGGYCFCSPKTHRVITMALATGAGARAIVPDYRLAPEHRFPAALDDALAAYRRLLAEGTPSGRIVLGGDSAGGGLALALLLALRDAGDPLPAGAVLFSPWTDLAATGASIRTNTKSDAMFHGAGIALTARIYLGEASPENPLASPLYGDLAGLPPLFIQASDSEVLLDDSTRLADKAVRSGVAVSFRAWPGLPHVWQFFAPMLPEGRAALTEAAQFIRRVTP